MTPKPRPLVGGRPALSAFPETFNVPKGLDALVRRPLVVKPEGKPDAEGACGGRENVLEGGTSSKIPR